MKITPQKSFRITTITFTLSILAALFSIGVYVYVFHMVQAQGEANAILQSETDDLLARQSKVGELKKTLSGIQANEPKLASYFIDANDIVPFLEAIESYGRQMHVTVKFTNVDLKPSPPSLFVSLSANGTFPDIYRFLSMVEAAPYQFKISQSTLQLGNYQLPNDPKAPLPPITWDLNLALSVTSVTGTDATAAK